MARFLLFMVLLLFCLLPEAKADSWPADTVRLEEVVVVAAAPLLQERSAMPMQTMGVQELDRVSGFSAAEALKQFSGVNMKDYGGIGGLKTIMVRGLGAGHTAVMVDGISVRDAATGQADLGRFSLSGLASVSLFVGQPGQLLQPASYFSAGSVVDLRSRVPEDSEVHLGVKTGSFGLVSPYAHSSLILNSQTTASFYAAYTKAHGRYPFQTQPDNTGYTRLNSDMEATDLNLRLNHKRNEHARLELQAHYYNAERGLPGAVVLYNVAAGSQRLWNEDFSVFVRYRDDSPQGLQKLSTAKFSQSFLRYKDSAWWNEQGELVSTYTQREYYLSQALAYPLLQKLKFSYASDFFVQTLDATLPDYARPVRYSWLNHLAARFNSGPWEAMGGMLLTLSHDDTQMGKAAGPANALSPSFSLLYRMTSSEPLLRLRFMYKHVFRMPTFNDLYYAQVGNPDLRPEYAQQFNVGIMGNYRVHPAFTFHGTADVFYNRVKDKIVAIPTKNLFVWSMQNIGEVDIRGLELHGQAAWRFSPLLKVNMSMNYTHQKAVDVTREDSPSYRNQVPYIPRETFSGSAGADYSFLSAGLSTTFSGFRYVLAENIYENMLPSWWHHDVFMAVEFSGGPALFSVKFEVSNLLNHQYEVIKSFPMPGRAFYITLESRF